MSDVDDECGDSLAGLLADLAEEYLTRRARGESPNPEEYAARHPSAADAIRGILASLRVAAPAHLLASSHPAIHPATPGELGDYRIIREVGRGGMGVVYEAEQLSLRRRVALKVFPFAAVADPRHLQRFKNEALAAAALDHPHVVTVYAVGSERGVHYLAMQFVDGRTLADLIQERRDGTQTPHPVGSDAPTRTRAPSATAASTASGAAYTARVAEWGIQAAEALEHAHSLGIVHRDVKPSNLLVDNAGKLYVADFGLAKLGSDPGMTGTGDLLGTARYMSPEQALARHGLVDHRSDVYSLGATLYELLTLHPVIGGDHRADALRRIVADDPVPPRQFDRQIPSALETVILKAMAKDLPRRYQSARELADDLRRFLEHRPVLARPPSVGERIGQWVRRHAAVARAGLAALAVALAALVVSTLLIARAYESEARHRRDAEDASRRADGARRDALDRAASLRLELYPTDLRQAHQAWENGEPGQLRELLDRHRPRAGEPDRREFAWHYLDACARTHERVLPGHEFPLLSADVTADGRWAATSDRGGVVKLWDAAAGRELRSARYSQQEVTSVQFSPDGRTLATCGQDRTIRLWDVATWTQTACLRGHTHTVTGVSWSPDGTKLASGGRDNLVMIWDVAAGGEPRSLVGHSDVVRCVAWSPDGTLVASAGPEPGVRLWNPATGKPAGTLKGHAPGSAVCLAFSTSGEFLASGGYERTVIVHDVRRRRPAYQIAAAGHVWSLAFSPDDRHLIVGRTDRVEVWDGANPSRVVPVRTLAYPGRVRALALTPDGRTLLAGSEEGREARLVDATRLTGHGLVGYPAVCRAVVPNRGLAVCAEPSGAATLRRFPGGGIAAPLAGQTQPLVDIAVSPTGNHLVTSDTSGRVVVWNPTTGRRARELAGHRGSVYLAVSPDAALVAGGGVGGITYVWRAETGELVKALKMTDSEPGLPAFSADGSLLATRNGESIVLWRVGAWSRQTVLAGTQTALAMAFSPDSGILAAGGSVNGTTLWEVSTGRRLAVLAEQTGPVVGVAFSPDGQTLATAGADHTIRLWHVPTRRELFTLRRHDTQPRWVRFASPNRLLVGADGRTPGRSEVLVFPPLDS